MATEYTMIDGDIQSPQLTLYALSFCPSCKQAKEYLQELGFAFRYLEVDKLPKQEILRVKREIEATDSKNILYPVLKIDDDFVYGFNKEIWAEKLGQSARVQ